ncbi:MAG: two-component regulator propeller domain-containing protein [Acidobacteriota bacterium]
MARGEHLPVKTYTVADGLLRDSVYKIRQDEHGFLWFCTAEGVSRFDGYGFTNFTVDDGLPDRHVNDFLQTRQGIIYLATDGGLARLDPKGIRGSTEMPLFTIFNPEDDPSAKFQTLIENNGSEIVAGSDKGLYFFDGTTFKKAKLGIEGNGKDTADISTLIFTKKGWLFVGTSNDGLFFSGGGTGERNFEAIPQLPEQVISSLFEAADGRIWVGLRPGHVGGLCRLAAPADIPRVEKCFTASDGLSSSWIPALLETSSGKFWVGTTRGLCLWQGEGRGVCKTYTAANDLCDLDIWSLFEDKDGNLWIGSRCGLKKLSGNGFSYYTDADGLGRGVTNSIFENRAGRLFATVTNDDGRVISRSDGDNFTPYKPRFADSVRYFGWGWKQTVVQDSADAWWVPTGSGLYRSPPGTDITKLKDIALQQTRFPQKVEIFRIFEDRDSNVWVATTGSTNELWRWERSHDKWHNYSEAAQIDTKRLVTAFAEDHAGNLWIGTGSDNDNTALLRFRNGEFHVFTKSDSSLLRGWIRDLYVDDAGRLWIADTTDGLLRLDDPAAEAIQLANYTTSNSLSSNGAYCVTGDVFGRIYVGSGRGLDRLDSLSGIVENFTTFDGLPDSTVEECYRDRVGDLWFGTSRGLAHYVPKAEKSRKPPSILITGLRINGAPKSVSILGENSISQMNLDSGQQAVSIDFVGLGATLGEKLRYEYTINNSDWTPTTDRTLNFVDLQSGNYTLSIRSLTRDAIRSDFPATVSFRIAAPLWRRWWFIAGIFALAVFIVSVFYRYRLTRLLEMERTRTRIATDLHDDIGSNLSKISLLSDVVNMQLAHGNTESKRMLTTIAEVSRSSVASMRDIVWAIDPGRDSVLEMTRKMREHAEDVMVPRNISVKFDSPERGTETRLSMDVRRELFLIFKEAINNAERHSNCSHVDIDFHVSGHEIVLEIVDNGLGFDISEQMSGNGLSNMKRRAEKLNGRIAIRSASDEGTCISLTISRTAHANT